MLAATRALFSALLATGVAAFAKYEQEMMVSKSSRVEQEQGSKAGIAGARAGKRQKPEDLGFDASGTVDEANRYFTSEWGEGHCLDIGAKGFPIPVFTRLKKVDWDARKYFERIQEEGYADDALQMTGPQAGILQPDCMRGNFHLRSKHIFVGDSQMMTLRNAMHRLSKCPEIWWTNASRDVADLVALTKLSQKRRSKVQGRFHSRTEQAPPSALPLGCQEEGIASFIFWDAWASPEIPVAEIQKEMQELGLEPKEGDNVVVWIGSNFIPARQRRSVLLDSIDKLHMLGVKMVWDSPTFQDDAIMAATSTHDSGRDKRSRVPIIYTQISQRKAKGESSSNGYHAEKALFDHGVEVPMTKRWQLTNRYRGLQCDGIHTDMRGRDPLFYSVPCPMGKQAYGQSIYCNWVEPFQDNVTASCPQATGLDDLVLQSGLYALCAAHEEPFCYYHTDNIR